jgi:flagellar hook-associated protein 1 FlgK
MSLIDSAQVQALSKFLDITSARHRVITTNIANVETPGYSRQRAELAEADAFFNGRYMVGTGVELEQITSLRDRVLELRIQDEKQQQGALESQIGALQQIETLFSADTATIGDAMNEFFNAVSALSVDPANVPLRQSLLMRAENLAKTFRSTATTLQQRQFNLDLQIEQSVSQVNELIQEIAKLNGEISSNPAGASTTGNLEDRRNELLRNLSYLIGNQIIKADDGLSVTTGEGTPLVVGNKSTPLNVTRQADGTLQIQSEQADITQQISGGSISGLLQVRQQTIPGLLGRLDSLAADLAVAINAVHRTGKDLDGNAGSDLFSPPPLGNIGAAAAIIVSISDPRQLAASSAGSAGSNGNLNALLALREQGIIGGDRPSDYYAKIAFSLGSQLANSKTELDASDLVIEQLTEQRGAISSVSLDEEAANLIRYQRAFEAAARVLSILSDLTETSVNLGRN